MPPLSKLRLYKCKKGICRLWLLKRLAVLNINGFKAQREWFHYHMPIPSFRLPSRLWYSPLLLGLPLLSLSSIHKREKPLSLSLSFCFFSFSFPSLFLAFFFLFFFSKNVQKLTGGHIHVWSQIPYSHFSLLYFLYSILIIFYCKLLNLIRWLSCMLGLCLVFRINQIGLLS